MRDTLARLVVIGSIVSASSPSLALACSCMAPAPPTAALELATQVFSGRVTASKDLYAGSVIRSSMDPVEITFAVDRVWKGGVGRTTTVRTASSGASCGYSFRTGESYLVYARDSYVSLCSRTKLIAAASEDLAELGAGHAPNDKSEPLGRPTEMPSPTREDNAAVDTRDHERCPAGKTPVEERLTGFLDLERLVGTYDQACADCTIRCCQTEPRHGPFESRYPNGQTHMRGFYKDGKRQGAWASWHRDGKKHYEGGWRKDRKVGLWKLWYENGNPQAELEYTDDVSDGRWIWWYENGNPKIEGAHERGERVGIWRIWDEDGTLRAAGPGGKDPSP